jgi:hypothetical protein
VVFAVVDVISIALSPLLPLLTKPVHSVNDSDLPPTVIAPDAEFLTGLNISKYGLVVSYPLTIKFPFDRCTITPDILADLIGLLTFKINE